MIILCYLFNIKHKLLLLQGLHGLFEDSKTPYMDIDDVKISKN